MNRRKGVPCGCDADPCGCSPKNHCVKAISNVSPDPNGDFTITEGDNIEITEISNGIEIGMKNPLTDDLNIQADLTVDGDIIANGDIIQNGSSYETHAEKVYTNDDYIVMRDGAVGPLAASDYSGFQVKKYDGTNDGRLVIDRDGTARVGDVGDEQPLATRDESADLTDGHLVKWDAANLKLTDAGAGVDDLGMEFVEEGMILITPATPNDTENTNIALSNNMKFEAGYDYYLQILNADPSVMANLEPAETVIENNHTWNLKYQASGQFQLRWRFYRMKTNTPLGGGSIRINAMVTPSVMLQEKLVSGTNIKTINNTSILGSGDITIAGGLEWTARTANADWSDLFKSENGYIVAKKNIWMISNDSIGNDRRFAHFYMPKDTKVYGSIKITMQLDELPASADTIIANGYVMIEPSRITGYTAWRLMKDKFTISTDGSSITVSRTQDTSTIDKAYFQIFTAD